MWWVGVWRMNRNYQGWFRRGQDLKSKAVSRFLVSQSLVFKKYLRYQILQKVMVHRGWLGKKYSNKRDYRKFMQ